VRVLLCLCRLCLTRCACTWVALSVNLNNKHNDRGDDDGTHITLKFINMPTNLEIWRKNDTGAGKADRGGGGGDGKKKSDEELEAIRSPCSIFWKLEVDCQSLTDLVVRHWRSPFELLLYMLTR